MSDILIAAASASSPEALLLQDELSAVLQQLSGDSGRASFDAEAPDERGGFYLARNSAGQLLGCAALRPLGEADSTTGELKRMFARPGNTGVGAALLAHAEVQARQLGYRAVYLSTRVINTRAVAFYRKHGYAPVEPWGKYVGAAQSVCLGKLL
ncbi:GNAT family N-acetyltransferase [Janthinobacterium sp.]|uniref:GNAT family N-acetyltransferase n=1 Tax=Janthinobacterium sp. TaxID=1871054 RepID=UPI0028991091|nr:GNAT family N-acetyltransferase [Janthinobacterium sp.]